MRILITGICGFVGRVLAEGLRGTLENAEISGIDNLSRKGSERNFEFLKNAGFDVRQGDIRSPKDLAGLPRADWILDCAANPTVLAGVDGKTPSRRLVEDNLVGTLNILEQCKEWGAGLILLSTSRVYSIEALTAIPMEAKGDRFEPAQEFSNGIDESFPAEPPLSLYGSSKRASEVMALEYGSAFGFPVHINRCSVLAGAGQFGKIDQGIFSYWIHAYAQKRPLQFIGFGGTGRQVRDGLCVRDLVPLMVRQIHNRDECRPKILNLGGGRDNSMSLKELTGWCESRFGKHDIGTEPETRKFDVPWVVMNNGLAEETWGWKPQTKLELVLEEIAQHAEQNPDWLKVCEG